MKTNQALMEWNHFLNSEALRCFAEVFLSGESPRFHVGVCINQKMLWTNVVGLDYVEVGVTLIFNHQTKIGLMSFQ